MKKEKTGFKPFWTVLLLLLIGITSSYAQQTATFSEYNYNPFMINSAYTGLLHATEMTISNSGFSSNIEGSPKNFSLSINAPLRNKKIGLGAGFVRDEIGVTSTTTFFMAYSYKLFFDFDANRPFWQVYQPGVLSFGITAGIQQFQDNLLELNIPSDPNFAENIHATIPTIGVGFLFNHARFYAGISAPNVLGDQLASRDDLNLSNPIYGYFGYRYFTNLFQEVMFKPNMLLKYENGAPIQADINLAASFKHRFEIGAGYRTSSSVNVLVGVYFIKNLRLIYHYNIALKDSPLGNTHGLMLSFIFGDGYYGN